MIVAVLLPAVLALISPVVASCDHGLEVIHPRTTEDDGTVTVPSYSYGLSGPLNWHNLDPKNYLCGNGTNQSPILLDSTSALAPSGSVTLSVPTANNVTFENLGTTVEIVMGGTLTAASKKWTLEQFHFHTPSEHRVNLGHYEAEMHMVFQAADDPAKTAVLAFFIEVAAGQSTQLLESVFSHLKDIQTSGTATVVPQVDFTAFQKNANSLKYYQYTGSLTTPPCTEGVSWFLATTPIKLKVNTYASLKSITKTNNRYTQNLLGQKNILQVAAAGL